MVGCTVCAICMHKSRAIEAHFHLSLCARKICCCSFYGYVALFLYTYEWQEKHVSILKVHVCIRKYLYAQEPEIVCHHILCCGLFIFQVHYTNSNLFQLDRIFIEYLCMFIPWPFPRFGKYAFHKMICFMNFNQ